MNKLKLLVATALAVTISAVSSSPSIAQADDNSISTMGGGCPGMMGESMSGPGMMGGGVMGPRTSHMASVIANRLTYLKDNLKINAAQNEAWNGYADALKGRLDAMQSARAAMMNSMKAGTA